MNHIKILPSFPCQIRKLNLSCWGCCGREFGSRSEIEKDIEINTYEFSQLKNYNEKELLKFRDRLDEDRWALTPSGICSNLVDFNNGCLACPLHNLVGEIVDKKTYVAPKKDLRIGHCDENYECKTLILWKTLSLDQKEKYVEWLSKKTNLDHYSYSTKNIDGVLIKEFLSIK